MNLIIEIIDGVAYILVEGCESGDECDRCALCNDGRCSFGVMCGIGTYYRRPTIEEFDEVTKALGRGME